ncbi:MAG: glycosyltransferase [Planctomycetota bacterium]
MTDSTSQCDANLPRVLAFEMQTGGHHPSYIRNFAMQWAEKIQEHGIDFLVTKQFQERHDSVFELVNELAPQRIRMLALTKEESHQVRVESKFREFAGWKLFCSYAESLRSSKAMLMYSDHFQLPMLVGRSAPCPVSCIYFRPTFHYGQLRDYRPTWKQRIAAWRKKWMLGRLLKLKCMDTLYCLDPLAIDYIGEHLPTKAKVRQLPDSFVQAPIPAKRLKELRSNLGIEEGRKVVLLLGILDLRKGPEQLLQAVDSLDEASKRKLCLVMAGKLDEKVESSVLAAIERLQAQQSSQIVLHNEYITDTSVQDYYELADIALTTYQRHMGMSSALIRAGLAGKPVLSSSYGLMGEIVRRHQLGIQIDTTDPNEFSEGLSKVINEDSGELFDASEALSFAETHSPDALGRTLQDWVES